MADYNLTAAPVVDDEQRMIGVITVDDVLEVDAAQGLAAALRPARRGVAEPR